VISLAARLFICAIADLQSTNRAGTATRCGGDTPNYRVHKEDMIRCADWVVFMKSGDIVEVGTYDEVCALIGELWNILHSGEWEG